MKNEIMSEENEDFGFYDHPNDAEVEIIGNPHKDSDDAGIFIKYVKDDKTTAIFSFSKENLQKNNIIVDYDEEKGVVIFDKTGWSWRDKNEFVLGVTDKDNAKALLDAIWAGIEQVASGGFKVDKSGEIKNKKSPTPSVIIREKSCFSRNALMGMGAFSLFIFSFILGAFLFSGPSSNQSSDLVLHEIEIPSNLKKSEPNVIGNAPVHVEANPIIEPKVKSSDSDKFDTLSHEHEDDQQ